MQMPDIHSASDQTLFEALLEAMHTHGKDEKRIEDIMPSLASYGDLLKKSLALGRLVAKVSAPNENVGVFMPNVTNTIALIFGMSAFARIPAMLNYTAGIANLQDACDVANIKTIITSRKFVETAQLDSLLAKLQNVQIHYLEDLRSHFTLWDQCWLFCFALRFPSLVNRAGSADLPAVVLFTSGSEGTPKGVVHSHRSILANIAQIRSRLDFYASDKVMACLPLFHVFGFTCGAIMPVVMGAKLYLYPSPLHYKAIPEIIAEKKCTVLFSTSTFLAHYATHAKAHDLASLRLVLAGAEKLNPQVHQTWMDQFGLNILEGYGATECAPVLAVNTPSEHRLGTVGKLLPELHADLAPVAGMVGGGILKVRGPNLMLGYYLKRAPGILQSSEGHFYDTGDIVEIDQEGFVKILGRVKRFSKVAGEMVSLDTVEKIAIAASPEHHHAASSVQDAKRGEVIVLFTTDQNLVREAIQHASKVLGVPEIAIPRKIIFIKELPLLATGKTDYLHINQMAEALG